jgi:hypothetical protein
VREAGQLPGLDVNLAGPPVPADEALAGQGRLDHAFELMPTSPGVFPGQRSTTTGSAANAAVVTNTPTSSMTA